MNNLLTEDNFVDWLNNNGAMLITRKISNYDNDTQKYFDNAKFVGITGYDHIVSYFFNNIIQNFKSNIILITLETDGFDIKKEYIDNPKLLHWFTWNKCVVSNKVSCIPIGLNGDRHENSLKIFMNSNTKNNKNKLLGINVNVDTNSTRKDVVNLSQNKWRTFCNYIETIPYKQSYWQESKIEGKIKINVTSEKCYEIMSEYKFIVSPPGAGYDCHRTWEALYLGVVPIIIKSPINEVFEDLPVVIVHDWNVINENFLIKKFKQISNNLKMKKYNMEKLYLNYWTNLINSKLVQ